ncbi:hypothetical protein CYMTET_56312 [Cymbomonas tetramitiformis]|uniref:beta-galactoside alpha-(2,6)-sialyltransferase n=1 Tax=Cymbomonas tetramitiformis TaxID=36881 RepID=A0AAE0BCF2_9CHLO|nr:hypothetical protein CYMTET_56312 [Cymbomonas tetramitiformis]
MSTIQWSLLRSLSEPSGGVAHIPLNSREAAKVPNRNLGAGVSGEDTSYTERENPKDTHEAEQAYLEALTEREDSDLGSLDEAAAPAKDAALPIEHVAAPVDPPPKIPEPRTLGRAASRLERPPARKKRSWRDHGKENKHAVASDAAEIACLAEKNSSRVGAEQRGTGPRDTLRDTESSAEEAPSAVGPTSESEDRDIPEPDSVQQADKRREGGDCGELAEKRKCRCERGSAVDCKFESARGDTLYQNLAVAAVCGVKVRVETRRREHRAEALLRETGMNDTDPSAPTREVYKGHRLVPDDPEYVSEVAALELEAAVSVLEVVWPMFSVKGSSVLEGANLFYTQQNHEKLREKGDAFKNASVYLPDMSTVDLHRYDRCAVVGNSGELTYQRYGEVIDTHQGVMRLNQAPTKDYEKDVGQRTTTRLLNKKWTGIYGRHHPELYYADDASYENDKNFTVIITRSNVQEFKTAAKAAKALPLVEAQHSRPPHVYFLTTRVASHAMQIIQTFRRALQEVFTKRYRGGNAASSGFLSVLYMLQRCGFINVYGFSLQECRGSGCENPYHYFTNYLDSEWLRAHPSHSFTLEAIILTAMNFTGRACVVLDHESALQCRNGVPVPSPPFFLQPSRR